MIKDAVTLEALHTHTHTRTFRRKSRKNKKSTIY